MTFETVHGNVSINANGDNATQVEKIVWEGQPGPNNSVPNNTNGILYTKDAPRVPSGHYDSGETIYYHDGNNNNWQELLIRTPGGYVGPTKYLVHKP